MSREELIHSCPPLEVDQVVNVSGRNRMKIPTIFVVDDIMRCGWEPVESYVRRSKSKNVRHVIVFTSPNLTLGIKNTEDVAIPQLILVADNGMTPYKLYMSFYRRQCDTRIIVPVKHGLKLTSRNFYYSFKSKDYTSQKLTQTLKDCVESLIVNSKNIFDFVDTILTDEQMNKFAALAFLRRKEIQTSLVTKRIDTIPSLTTNLLLIPFRQQDVPNNVWNILRRVHEKIIKGFKTLPTLRSKKLVRYKSLTNFEKIIRVSIRMYLDIHKIIQDDGNWK